MTTILGERNRGNDRRVTVALHVATVSVGLMAGLLFAFSTALMTGLTRLDDHTFVRVVREINIGIQNPVFGLVFIAACVSTAIAAILETRAKGAKSARWIWLALVFYFATVAITFGFNIPANNRLAAAGDTVEAARTLSLRTEFEVPWFLANGARTVSASCSLACLTHALVEHGRSEARVGGEALSRAS